MWKRETGIEDGLKGEEEERGRDSGERGRVNRDVESSEKLVEERERGCRHGRRLGGWIRNDRELGEIGRAHV